MNKNEIKKMEIKNAEIVALVLLFGILIWLIFRR
jgi:hypothetical protein